MSDESSNELTPRMAVEKLCHDVKKMAIEESDHQARGTRSTPHQHHALISLKIRPVFEFTYSIVFLCLSSSSTSCRTYC